MEEKVRENRLRRMAARAGYKLDKCRRRDPNALGFGTYQLVNLGTGGVDYADWNALGTGYGLDLDDIERWLTEGEEKPKPRKKAAEAPKAEESRAQRLLARGVKNADQYIAVCRAVIDEAADGTLSKTEAMQAIGKANQWLREWGKKVGW